MTDQSDLFELMKQRLLELDDFVNWVAATDPPPEQVRSEALRIRRTEFYPWEDEHRNGMSPGLQMLRDAGSAAENTAGSPDLGIMDGTDTDLRADVDGPK